MHWRPVVSLAALVATSLSALLPDEADYCEGVDLIDSSVTCSQSNCLCRLQRQRSGAAGEGNFVSIEEGCFAQQDCPDVQSTLTINEPIKCLLSANSETREFNFDDRDFESTVTTDNSGDGKIMQFEAGLHAGQEIAIVYDAVGETGLALGIGIGCDGFIYLMGEDKSSGTYTCPLSQNDQGMCSTSCPNCVLCSSEQGAAYGTVYHTSSYMPLEDFTSGVRALAGNVYIETNNELSCLECDVCSWTQCEGKDESKEVTIACALESNFDAQVSMSNDGNSSNSSDDGVTHQGNNTSSATQSCATQLSFSISLWLFALAISSWHFPSSL